MTALVPPWAEIAVAVLLVLSGMFVVVSAAGFLCLKHFFLRMHPPALAYTVGSWCVTLAGILYFTLLESRLMLHPWLIIIMLSISVPVTTLLLARVALFRRRVAGIEGTPPPLTAPLAGTRQAPLRASNTPKEMSSSTHEN
jgi:multicomponent K+:H+ antiporter subunit G